MKVEITTQEKNLSEYITEIKFSNRNVTNIEDLRFIISSVCANYCFEPNCITNDYWGFETWFKSINPNGAYKKYKVICGYNGEDCVCEWY